MKYHFLISVFTKCWFFSFGNGLDTIDVKLSMKPPDSNQARKIPEITAVGFESLVNFLKCNPIFSNLKNSSLPKFQLSQKDQIYLPILLLKNHHKQFGTISLHKACSLVGITFFATESCATLT